jgi:ribosome maturation factor RimP
MSSSRAKVVAAVEPLVIQAGYDLEDLVVTSAGRRRLVRIVVDRDGGVTLDDTAALSRTVSLALDDQSDLFGDAPFVLEVTSPGVDRPLTAERHWRRNLGRLVKVERSEPGTPPVVGRIIAVEPSRVTVETEDGALELALSEVTRAVVQVELNRRADGAADRADEVEVADDVAADDANDN